MSEEFLKKPILIDFISYSFNAEALLDLFGWKAKNIALIPWLVIAAVSLFWLRKRQSEDLI